MSSLLKRHANESNSMPTKSKAVVLDSWSVIAYLQDEAAGEEVGDLVADVLENGGAVLMSIINVGEVWYIFAREGSEKEADAAIADLRQIGVQFVDAEWGITRTAAAFKARGRMSYADTFAAALAKQYKCELVTGDPEFKTVEPDIKIRWVKGK